MATITGTTGNDLLYGGGPHTLVGLTGDDSYAVYGQGDAVVENPNEGQDTVLAFASYTLGAGVSVETLSTAINAASDPIGLTGNALSQIIVGNYGNNILDGGGGGDALAGLRGDDLYYVHGRNDLVVEQAGDGRDTVVASGDFVLGAGSSVEQIETVNVLATTPLFLGGNELAQSMYGNAGSNLINGGGGADNLYGGGGDDTYRIFGDGEGVTENVNAGSDRVFTSGSFNLGLFSSVEYLSTAVQAGTESINIAGNDMVQVIVGNYGSNILNGGGSGDTLIGLRGDDIYRVYSIGDTIIENAGEGNDAVYTSASYVLRAGVSVETLSTDQNSGTAAINLAGNQVAQTVIGNYGANLIDGGGGSDTLYGLAGADVFRFSATLGSDNVDTIVDFGNGADRIQLDPTIFTGLTNGVLPANAIVIGGAAADADDRIIYNPQTGALSFDGDGSGSAAAVQFATLPTGLAASAIAVTVAATSNAGPVTVTGAGTYLLGGATGNGVNLDATYPEATAFTFGAMPGGAPFNLVFGPTSYGTGRPPIAFVDGFAIGTFDFSQLGTGVSLRPTTDFLTTDGALIVAAPNFNEELPGIRPAGIVGTPFDDYIDQSLRPGVPSPLQPPRIGGSISGGAGNDTLIGARALDGGSGNDLLVGALGTRMTGGEGADTFRLPINTRSFGISQNAPNIVVDFTPGADRIELFKNIASDLATGALDPSRFHIGAEATTPDQRVIYDPATGRLFYDYNGSSGDMSGSIPLIATLSPGLGLTAADFTVLPGSG